MSTIEVNKITPVDGGTNVTLGDSGDTFTIPSGVTMTNNGSSSGFDQFANWSESSGNLLPSNASYGVYLGVNSATASNLLDDYEEGTWTPNVDGTTSIAYDNRVGRYTKIGDTVFVECLLQWNSASYSSPTAVFTVTGLPFAAINIHYVGVPGAVTTGASFNWNNTEGTSTSASIAAAATDSSTVVFNVGSSGENFSGSRIKNDNNGNGIVQIAMTYRTTA